MSDPTRRESAHGEGDTLREPGQDSTRREASDSHRPRGGFGLRALPRELEDEWQVTSALNARGGEADLFVVENRRGERRVLKLYRAGFEPKTEVLAKLNEAAPEHVIRLFDARKSEDGPWYELLEYAEEGALSGLAARHGGRLEPALVREVLVEVVEALSHLHDLGIEHRDLKPDNVLIRNREPLDLVLTDFGISSEMGSTVRFTSRDRTERYAPPEAMSGQVHKTRADYWSLGIMLVEMLSGEPPLSHLDDRQYTAVLYNIQTDDLVEGVDDPQWRMLCRGLLRREPRHRWGAQQVRSWLCNPSDPDLEVIEEEAAPPDTTPPIRFHGQDYRGVEPLGAAMAADWKAARHFLGNLKELENWLIQGLGRSDLSASIRDFHLSPSLSEEAQVFMIAHALNQIMPLSFRGRLLTDEALAETANKAFSGDAGARQWLLDLHNSNILACAAGMPACEPGVREAAHRWQAAIDEHQMLAAEVQQRTNAVTAPVLAEGDLARLLAAATPGGAALESLRAQTGAFARAARQMAWYARLGDPASAEPGAAMLLLQLGSVAESQLRAARSARRARNEALWLHMGIGAGLGLVVAIVWAALVGAYCAGGVSECASAGWYDMSFTVLDGVFLFAALTAAFATLVTVARRTSGGR